MFGVEPPLAHHACDELDGAQLAEQARVEGDLVQPVDDLGGGDQKAGVA
jgi:hypothetical protein